MEIEICLLRSNDFWITSQRDKSSPIRLTRLKRSKSSRDGVVNHDWYFDHSPGFKCIKVKI